MAQRGGARAERIEVRATAEEKQLLTAAATYERTDVTTFVLRKVLPAAREIVEREEGMKSSSRGTQRVLELLDNPPSLLRASSRRRERIRRHAPPHCAPQADPSTGDHR